MSSFVDPTAVERGALCAAMFDVAEGTGVCETFGPHEQHAGVVTVGTFRCHGCRRTVQGEDPLHPQPCRCPEPKTFLDPTAQPRGRTL